VVSSNVGGLPEVNAHGETGYLRAVGDVQGMAKDALDVLHDDRLPGFQERAKNRAQQFHIEQILPQYFAVYDRALTQAS